MASSQTKSINGGPSGRLAALVVAHRVALSLVGGYAFTWGFVALGMAALAALGVGFHEAETAMLLMAFLVFVPVFLWAFAAKSPGRVWCVLGGGALLMTVSAWGLQLAQMP